MKRYTILSLILSLVLAACVPATPTPASGVNPIDPPRQLRDFTLLSHTGKPMNLSDLRGKFVLLFFGFTNCPDVCPITMARFKQIKDELGVDAEKVTFIMISVDGKRDTPDVLAKYVKAFDPAFIGLTGDDAILRQIVPEYGVSFEIHEGEHQHSEGTAEAGSYDVDHTPASFLIDREGKLRVIFAYETTPETMLDAIKKNL